MELSLPLVVVEEVDSFVERFLADVERFLADEFDRSWDDDGLERVTSPEGVMFDPFNPRSQLKLFEPFARGEGALSDDFYRIGNFDRFEPFTPYEGCFSIFLIPLPNRNSSRFLQL